MFLVYLVLVPMQNLVGGNDDDDDFLETTEGSGVDGPRLIVILSQD